MGVDRAFQEPAFAPLHIDNVTATGLQALHISGGPGFRQRGQKADFALMTLHEKLGHVERGIEVAVTQFAVLEARTHA